MSLVFTVDCVLLFVNRVSFTTSYGNSDSLVTLVRDNAGQCFAITCLLLWALILVSKRAISLRVVVITRGLISSPAAKRLLSFQ